ncbi:PHP domain-containing protein [Leptospira andrefontaineae]|uniref:Phosphoesterase n=1 Tax=Leptospira andrefontaineae TaxID=2484976 RepID=A0A4R9H2X3_9LEPT|nr:phosphoesterase [Leptospira andrefontaineae]TGK39068.1 phosphoesterase [Leptospira andrefontaineae]
MKRSRIIFLVSIFLGVLLLGNLLTWAIFRSETFRSSVNWEKYSNPYKRNTNLKFQKTGIHLHTNRTWFTPGRNSPEEIETVYAANGYKILGFTDYERVTSPDSPKLAQIKGFEWGTNLRKRHFSVLGLEDASYDLFPLYADPENLQWVIDKLESKNGFVVINHPLLNESFPLKLLTQLKEYDALEVMSPFGDIPKFWDKLLSEKHPSFCMASDDLHYLPREEYLRVKTSGIPNWRDLSSEIYKQEGESLMRYLLVNTDSLDEKEILRSLKEGNYLCVRKMERSLAEPKLGPLGLNSENEIHFDFEDTPISVDFIGQNSEILSHTSYQNKGSYRLKPTDLYVRVQVIYPTAIILSNPFFQKH